MQRAKFILSKKKVLEQYKKVKEAADVVSYSSKTNQDVTKILEQETDCLFSVHRYDELQHVKDMSRIIFLAQAWDENFIKKIIDMGINYFVVDNETDLDVLLDFLEKNDVEINLLLRLKLKELTVRTEKYFVFGMPSETISKRIKELRNNKKIKQLGVHFHRKTQNLAEWNLKYEISNVFDENVLKMIDVVNIGGGIPSVYANVNEDVIPGIFEKIKAFKSWLKTYDIKMIIEPGRAIAAPSCKLKTQIKAIHGNNIIVSASVYNSDMDALIVPVKLLVEGELAKGEGEPYVIKGYTPCS
ncbi:MAG: decarboxylase, partial [archaeon]